MAEFNIEDVKKVLGNLREEIADSAGKRDAKESLASVLAVVVNTPDLLRENEKLGEAIDKNRKALTDIEADVSRETMSADTRIKELKAQVLTAETNLTRVERQIEFKIKELDVATEDILAKKRQVALEESSKIDEGVREKQKELDAITTKTDAAEARLKVFKENVARMNMSDV